MDRADDAVPIAELLDERRHLLDVAHWMLGSSGAAETVVDETYRRWFALSDPARARITAPRFWLAEVTGSICLARLILPGNDHTCAREGGTGGRGAERAAFVLDDVFGAPHTVADIVRHPGPECTEPAGDARRSLRARRARHTAPQQHDAVVRTVRRACATQDEALLTSVLAPDAAAFYDGGGKIRALVEPVRGNTQVARSLLTLLPRHPRTALHTRSVNGRTGLVVRYDHLVAAVISLDVADRHVIQIWAVLNPDKLRTWNRPSPTRR
ncbi:RNA polymerase subunit sigma [Streptomyces shenzhenensis]|uniref:RNA polymerase subunit sigma n=1 Tax=Streptomyces shenzhenensis TaxID=943815 RepID=A0A3M0I9D6_9ACTN|nr:RNA polymerase subunit sigma [Streptomyces shenzhenensis]RMB84952.1 RNA polymerase subunit sigma [Streptomyces shenzhenensis]